MGNYNFKNDLPLGQYGENIVIKDLEGLGGELIDTCDTYHYDFRLKYNNIIKCYEVKTDDFCEVHTDTGNMFIEFEGRGNPSGISITESDWFVYYYFHLGELWYIQTDKLKELLKYNEIKISVNSGDSGSNTKGYLLNRYQYMSNFLIHKVEKPSWDIYNKIKG